ncbi:MAG: hypothetical protein U0Y68_14370 [Blastocatellia bacterium]
MDGKPSALFIDDLAFGYEEKKIIVSCTKIQSGPDPMIVALAEAACLPSFRHHH